MPKLYIAEPEGEAVYEIFDQEVSLGRGAANGIQLADSGASKAHAVVRQLQGHWKIIDLESKNGVRVNGRYRNQHWLSDGDQLLIGTTTLRYAAEGAAEGSPAVAAAATAPVAAVPASPARAVPARPAPAAPVPAVAAPAAPAPAAPAPAAPAPARSAPAPAPRRRSAAPARSRGRYDDEGYDSEYDDLPPPRRRSTNSGSIVVIGIISAIALILIVWLIARGGTSHNQTVYVRASKIADGRDYQGALLYAEQNGDPDGPHYTTLVRSMADWKKRARAEKDLARSKEARDYYDYQIYRRQAVEGSGFRAKDALSDEEVVRMLRDFLVKYKGTPTSNELLKSEHSGFPALRDAMREYADESLKAADVMGRAQTELSILESKGQFGQVIADLAYLRDMNRLSMTAENWKALRNTVDGQIEEVKSKARRSFEAEKAEFRAANSDGRRGKALALLTQMREKYNGIPELIRGVIELESSLR